MTLLIVGSGGLFGRHAAAYLRAAGRGVVCASHRPGAAIRLDLHRPLGDVVRLIPSDVTHALICSSITDIELCRREADTTRRFNVERTIELIEALLDRAVQPIFLSSDLVFRGDTGNYAEDDPREPITEYGRQKKEVEDFILGMRRPFLVIRLSKLYSLDADDPSPVGQTVRALRAGRTVRAATDQVVSPTWVVDAVKAVDVLVGRKLTGIYHVAAPQRFTRYSLAMTTARLMGAEQQVERCSIKEFDFLEPRPSDNSLAVDKFISATNFPFSDLQSNLRMVLNRQESYNESPRQNSVSNTNDKAY